MEADMMNFQFSIHDDLAVTGCSELFTVSVCPDWGCPEGEEVRIKLGCKPCLYK